MEHILNQELIPLVNSGDLNIQKINYLISIREFINRVSESRYLENEKTYNTERKTATAITTWGDYFQLKLVREIISYSDEDFLKAIDTIKFDIISSYIIFSEKDSPFYDWIERWHADVSSKQSEVLQKEIEEVNHLKILMDYYINLRINNKFTRNEWAWYDSYKEAVAV